MTKTNEISIYIHWPFCLSKCPYCDFNSHVSDLVDHDLWLECYKKEIEYFQEYINGRYIKSIFFGGGTPSLMKPKTVAGIINEISKISIIDQNTEITLEANPTSFEIEKFKNFNAAGINRVSIGVQSLIDEDLQILGRNHSSSQAINALKHAVNIFPRFSFDLIYARTGQTLTNWQDELRSAADLAAGHISLYQLTIEKGTPFYKLFQTGNLILPEQEKAADMYEWTTDYLKNLGYNRYEISNYAKALQECRHNLTYWNYDNYLGIGPGAHSRLYADNNVRAMMMWHQPQKWIDCIQNQGHAIQTSANLSVREMVEEIFIMGLRLKEGITNDRLKQLTGCDIKQVINQQIAATYQEEGLIQFMDNNLKLTDRGLMLHNYIVPRILGNI
jgi:putative oxygen-independent coproporphyrinogen III oxidase